jgi:hypothetical protein
MDTQIGVNFLDILKEANNDHEVLIKSEETNYLISYLKNSQKYLLITNFQNNLNDVIENEDIITMILEPKDCIKFFKESYLEKSTMEFCENFYHKMTKNIIDNVLNEIGVISFYGNNNISHYFRDNEEIFIFEKKSMKKTSNVKEKTFKDNIQKENIYQRIFLLLKESNAEEELLQEIEEESQQKENKIEDEIEDKIDMIIEEKKIEVELEEFSREKAIIKLMNKEIISNKEFINKFLKYDIEEGTMNIFEINENEFNFEFKPSDLDQNSIWKEISKFSDGWLVFKKPSMKFQYLYQKDDRFETTDFYENIEDLKLDKKFVDNNIEDFEIIKKSKKIIK